MQKIKCVIFDLDNTIWDGTVLEGDVRLRKGITEIIKELDRRGILLSIASKSERNISLGILEKYKLKEYFVFPQICWQEKWKSICEISKISRIDISNMAFVDDDDYELAETKTYLKDIVCISANDIYSILANELFKPEIITEESRNRRKFFLSEVQYVQDYEQVGGKIDEESFFRKNCMQVTYRRAVEKDKMRIIELICRTRKINSNIRCTIDPMELHIDEMIVVEYEDIYFKHGMVGVFWLIKEEQNIKIKLISMSCRLISKKVIQPIIAEFINKLSGKYINIYACFYETEYNLQLKLILKSLGFIKKDKECLCRSIKDNITVPKYIIFKSDKERRMKIDD